MLEAFIARYAETFYADLARARIEDLRKQRPSAAAPRQSMGSPRQSPACCDGMHTQIVLTVPHRPLVLGWTTQQCQQKSGA